ncbi:MAG: LysR substrate-binding domain-containing protein [Arenicella sp.]
MKRALPPLNALKVFEVAGRTENFSKAADELCITQSAVSKQIRILEENLNTQLFSRNAGVVQITDAGEQLLHTIIQAFDGLEEGTRQFYKDKTQEKLTINITPSLSSYWMFERVERFSARFPKIALYLNSDEGELDWVKSGSDLAIQVMPRQHNHQHSELILKEKLILVATPNLLASTPINKLEDIFEHKLIANNNRPNMWANFFKIVNLENTSIDTRFGCQHTHMTVNAALQGFGLALVPKLLCERFLENQQLENPLGIQVDSGRGYYFLSPPHKRDERKVRLFYDWITKELKESD